MDRQQNFMTNEKVHIEVCSIRDTVKTIEYVKTHVLKKKSVLRGYMRFKGQKSILTLIFFEHTK